MSKVQIQGRTDGITGLLNNLRIDANGALATTGGGGDPFDGVIKANDGNDGGGTERTIKCNANGELSTTNTNITKGQGVIPVNGELQQVLMYGRKPDATLQPLETIGDRLLVDVLELSPSGKITTSTALSSVQVCGYDTGTSQFKTIKVDGDGNVLTKEQTTITENEGPSNVATTRIMTNSCLTGSQQNATNLKHLLETDSTGKLLVAVGGYTDISDIGTWDRCAVENNYGSLFVRSKNSTNTSWSSLTLADSSSSVVINCQDTTTIRIWGNISANHNLQLEFAETNGSWKPVMELVPLMVGSYFSLNQYFNLSPNFIRLTNNSGVSVDLGLYVEQGHD